MEENRRRRHDLDSATPVKRLRRLLTSGNLWLYILSLLRKRKLYAYELDKLIETEFGFRPDRIMIYVVLYRLEAEGLITSEYEERRKYYTITGKGEESLNVARDYFRMLSGKL
ncbi:MAG TPA: PadR family transcriptional regulator [Candidatus Bilamarchaeum sp.]|nr:PadR family transcriptional regulator [Candidatus Bilamarchaeum sp.]